MKTEEPPPKHRFLYTPQVGFTAQDRARRAAEPHHDFLLVQFGVPVEPVSACPTARRAAKRHPHTGVLS